MRCASVQGSKRKDLDDDNRRNSSYCCRRCRSNPVGNDCCGGNTLLGVVANGWRSNWSRRNRGRRSRDSNWDSSCSGRCFCVEEEEVAIGFWRFYLCNLLLFSIVFERASCDSSNCACRLGGRCV